MPVTANIPGDAKSFTIVIEDATGARIRNLLGDGDPEIYGGAIKDEKRTVTVLWDGLNDDGKPVAPGNYKVRGLVRGALSAEYEMCFYNPGTPPWGTADGTGAWGADHNATQWRGRGRGPDGVALWFCRRRPRHVRPRSRRPQGVGREARGERRCGG